MPRRCIDRQLIAQANVLIENYRPGTPGQLRSSAPKLGDDTDAVLAELGMSEADIRALRARGVAA